MAKKPAPKPISLNEEQQAVVNLGVGKFACLAGPGSGKSACISARYARLIREGVSPDDILALSFTNTASKNLTDRVEAQVGKLSSKRKSGATTFHGLGLAFAIEERDEFPFELAEFPLSPEPVSSRFCSVAARRFEVDRRSLQSYCALRKRERVGYLKAVSRAENSLDAGELKLALAYKAYEKALRDAGVLDFDGLIFHMVEILAKKPEVRQRWVRDWIMVDEAQDCAKIEWELVKLIAGKSLLAVGDTSQGVYQFRGSAPELFAEMDKLFPGTQTLFLSANYRSSKSIVDFIRPYAASQELAQKFHTENEPGPPPVVKGFVNSADECAWVVSQLKEQQ